MQNNVTQDGLVIDPILAFLDLSSEINVIHPTFAEKLGLVIRSINVDAQKINGTIFEIYEIVIVAFSVIDQADKVKFFEKTFLVANISPDVIFGMPFLTLSDVDINFPKKKLQWRPYIIEKDLPITKRVELVEKKEFATATFNPGYEIFVVHIVSLENPSQKSDVHPSCRAQIAALVANEAPTLISTEYSDFTDIFSPKLALKLLEHTRINDYAIKLVDNQQPPYGPLYSLGLVELETLKTYIKTNLANGFIKLSKFPARAPILFDKKSDKSLWLCVDYRGLNNLIIKNQYPLLLVGESLD